MKYIIFKGKVAVFNNTHFIFIPLDMLPHYITATYVIIQYTKFLAVQYNDNQYIAQLEIWCVRLSYIAY